MATSKKEPEEKGTTEVSPGAGGASQDVASTGGGGGGSGEVDEPVSDDVKQGVASGQPVEEQESTVSTQVTPIPGVPEGRPAPGDWTPPGDHIKGFFPGDPNTYPDPENPQQSY